MAGVAVPRPRLPGWLGGAAAGRPSSHAPPAKDSQQQVVRGKSWGPAASCTLTLAVVTGAGRSSNHNTGSNKKPTNHCSQPASHQVCVSSGGGGDGNPGIVVVQ